MTNLGIVDLAGNDVHLEIAGLRALQVKIPSDFVPYSFAPILGQHHLTTGDKLQNGMIVVVEDRNFRENPERLSPEYPARKDGFVPSEYDRARVAETARWALVTDLKYRPNGPKSEIVSFTAIYADGTMRSRSCDISIKWAVLVESEVMFEDERCSLCGEVHSSGDETTGMSDVPPVMDILGRIAENFLQAFKELEGENDADEVPESEPLEDETPEEYADRLRDEAEARNEYSQDEVAKLRNKLSKENGRRAFQTPARFSDPDALARLREQLSTPRLSGE